EQANAQAVREQPEEERPGREGVAESLLQPAVIRVAQTVLIANRAAELGERHAVHVVQHRRQQQQPADAVAPQAGAFARGVGQASHALPSQAMTRSSIATTSAANAR